MNMTLNSETKENIESIRQQILDLAEKWVKFLKESEEYIGVKETWVYVILGVIAYMLAFPPLTFLPILLWSICTIGFGFLLLS